MVKELFREGFNFERGKHVQQNFEFELSTFQIQVGVILRQYESKTKAFHIRACVLTDTQCGEIKEDPATIGNGKPQLSHIIRKKGFGTEQENVKLNPPSPSLPSLVKPSNLPITRIAPSDVISVDAKIKPLKMTGQ